MNYLFRGLDKDYNELAAAIEWWRKVFAPILQSTKEWNESPRTLGLDGSELDFSNPVYAIRTSKPAKTLQVIQQPPPPEGVAPELYVLIRRTFEGEPDVNGGAGVLVLDIGCPASELTAEKVMQLARGWVLDDLPPLDMLSLAKHIQAPCKGFQGIDLPPLSTS